MYVVQGVSIQAISLKYVKAMRVPILVTKANSCPNIGTRVSQHRRGVHVLRHFLKNINMQQFIYLCFIDIVLVEIKSPFIIIFKKRPKRAQSSLNNTRYFTLKKSVPIPASLPFQPPFVYLSVCQSVCLSKGRSFCFYVVAFNSSKLIV